MHGRGEIILVVDDEEAIRGVTQAMLSQHNYRVLSAADGPEALAILALHLAEVEVVITDLAMPRMDGITLARMLKKMKPDLRIIVSTGRGDDPELGDLDAAGVAACLGKPYKMARLLQTLQEVLQGGCV